MSGRRLPITEELARARRALERFVDRATASDQPIVVGPWLAEVGIELLYWVPFIRRLVRRHGIDPERLVIVSRGGAESWYSGLHGRYADVFDAVTPAEFRDRTEELWLRSGSRKQVYATAWEQRVLRHLLGRSTLRGPRLHPSLLYALFRLWWRGAVSTADALDLLELVPLTAPDPGALATQLPDTYTAVRFYFRPSFADSPQARRIATDVLTTLAEHGPVVLLNTRLELDDHPELVPPDSLDVIRPLEDVPAARNLHVQSAVIAGSQRYVGTYGGLAYLAPLYGRPSVAFATERGPLNPTQHDLERRLLPSVGGSLTIIDPPACQLLGLLAPRRTSR